MAFSRPTLTTLISRAQSDIETRLPGSVASLRRSVERVLARVVAGAAHGLHGHLVWLSKQLLPDTAQSEFATRWASIWGLTRIAATKASGQILVTGTNTTVCPDGTLWQTADGIVYVQDGDVTISGGQATADVDAQTAGDDGNLDVSSTVSLVTPVSGIDTDATVTGADIDGGYDAESDASLLSRLLARLATPPSGGGPGDYVAWTLEVSGNTRAWEIANGDGAGTVVVYFVMDDKVGTIIPDAGEISTTQTYLDSVAPITADVNVYAPTAVDVDFTISVTPDTAAVRAAVEAELEAYITRESEADGVTFPISQLDEAISLADGETDHTMTVPAAAPTFTTGQIAVMGTVTWV